ncbi:hypothetical protein D3C71_1741380 [compost metagenome]
MLTTMAIENKLVIARFFTVKMHIDCYAIPLCVEESSIRSIFSNVLQTWEALLYAALEKIIRFKHPMFTVFALETPLITDKIARKA